MDEFRFLSLNVGRNKSLPGLKKILSEKKVDIVFLQEVVLSLSEMEGLVMGWGFEIAVNFNGKTGLAIMWRDQIPMKGVTNIVDGGFIGELYFIKLICSSWVK